MNSAVRGWRSLWPALLIVLLILMFSAALLREGRLRDMDVARLGSMEAATQVAEAFSEGREPNLPDSAVTGWGIYSPEGSALAVWGTAPLSLPAGDANPVAAESVSSGRLRTVRSLLAGDTAARGRRGESGAGGFGMRRRVLIDWDMSAGGNPGGWRLAGASGLTVLAVGLLLMQQRSARREARQKRLVQLGMAARTLTHEIRNPLGVLKAQEALLRRTLPPEFAQDVAVIGEEVDRLKTLTDRVRDWLSDPRGRPAVFDAPSELRRIVNRLPWKIETVFTDGEIPVRMDPILFASAVENLIRNAVESQEDLDSPPPVVDCRTRGRRVRITVDDRGRGLPKVSRASLFDPFYTTKTRGSGVGLPLARQLVEAAGGRLEIGNREGGGVRAVIDLPREKD